MKNYLSKDYFDFTKQLIRKMRTTCLVTLVFASSLFASNVNSQVAKVSIAVKNAYIIEVIRAIENQTDYLFVYDKNEIDLTLRVDLVAENKSVAAVLNGVFSNTNVVYAMEGNNIMLMQKSNSQQQKSVSGKVTDSSGEGLPGVSVVLKGTTTGSITDTNGNYSLSNIPENAIVQFSFVGMKSQEITVGSKSNINVMLEEETVGIEEVVAIGYGTQKRATLTGSIESVSAKELTSRPAANSTELLQGEIAGLVTRQSSGLPGSDGTTLNIRGFGDPLVLVDGIPSQLAQVDPNDIESISVLKDASASVYGARAGNGVILVTTKRGNNKKSQISYNGSTSMANPTFRADMVNAKQWAEMVNGTGLNPDHFSPKNVHYDPESNSLTNLLDGSEYLGYDWAKAIYRNWAPQQQHNLSANGGNDKIRYYVSAGITDQKSNFKSGDYNFSRYNIRSNIDANITDDLIVSLDFSYRISTIDKANFDVDEMFNATNHAKPVYPYIIEADPSRAAYSGDSRPAYSEIFKENSGFVKNQENAVYGSLALQYSFPMIKGLKAKAMINYEDIFSWDKKASKRHNIWQYDPIAASEGKDPWLISGIAGNNQNISVYSDRSNEYMPTFSLEYEKHLNNHHIKGLVLSETRQYKWTSLLGSRINLLSFEAPYLNYASEEGKDNSEGTRQSARSSVVGRLNYDYSGKYLFEFAIRADASAEYPPKGRWGYFPSISAGWRISEEPFIKDKTKAIDNLKLRASYGILGNDAVSSFDYLTGYEITGDYYVFGTSSAPVISSAGLPNPDITWETMKISNIGLDGTFWGGKLGFAIDAFYRLRENILTNPITQVPNTFGASLPKTNLNKRDNRGFEITLTHKGKLRDITYNISPMFSWTRGKYVKLNEDVLPVTEDMDDATKEFNMLWNNRYVNEGQWDDRQWGYVSNGFFMNQNEIDEYPINQDQAENQTIKVGDIKYIDLNGDNFIDWRDQKVIGKSGLPKIMYSMDMGARYKGWGLRMLWQGASAYTVTFGQAAAAGFSNETVPLELHYQNRAIVGIDNEGKEFITNPDNFKLPPATQSGNTANNSKNSDFWTFDARFLRLKSLNISYSLPQKLLSRTLINQCELYMSGSNLLTFSNLGVWKNSFDPEIVNQLNRSYPPVKTLTFGLKLTI